jgi:hypothetical protein
MRVPRHAHPVPYKGKRTCCPLSSLQVLGFVLTGGLLLILPVRASSTRSRLEDSMPRQQRDEANAHDVSAAVEYQLAL